MFEQTCEAPESIVDARRCSLIESLELASPSIKERRKGVSTFSPFADRPADNQALQAFRLKANYTRIGVALVLSPFCPSLSLCRWGDCKFYYFHQGLH